MSDIPVVLESAPSAENEDPMPKTEEIRVAHINKQERQIEGSSLHDYACR